jgi:type IX secretion system substrate protein
MRKYLFLLFSFFQITYSLAQPFGGNNAVWHYNICWWWNSPVFCDPVILNSSPPNIINGTAYYTISYTNPVWVCSTDTNYTVYESNDSVYYWLPASNRFTLLYDWNALPGDTQIIYGNTMLGGEDSVVLIVDSTSVMNINGFNKKIFYTSDAGLSGYFMFGGTIIEDIGCTSFLFPQYGFCDPFTGPLRCYEDTIIGLYQPWMPGAGCDSVIYLGENESTYTDKILIYPNPAKDFLGIHSNFTNAKEMEVMLFNLFGQKLKALYTGEFPAGRNEMKFSLKEIPAGIYFVRLIADDHEAIKKIVKY